MGNDAPQTPAAPGLPANYDSNTGTVAANSSAPSTEPVDLTDHVARVGGRTIQPAETELKNQETMNQGKADYKSWLYQNSPEEFKKAYPAEYLYRKGYNYAENAITAPATRPLGGGKAEKEIAPKIHELAEAGMGMYGLVKPGQAEPVFKQGIALPITEGVGLMPEDIEAVGGRTLSPAPKPTSQATVSAGGTGALSSEELARPSEFIKYSKSGEPMHLGKQPDATLAPGEAVLAVNKQTGEVRVQNTSGLSDAEALNKFGKHAKEHFGATAHVMPVSEEPIDLGEIGTAEKVERPSTVWKSSAVVDPKIQNIVEGTGGVYRGQNKDGIVEITLPLSMTHDLPLNESFKKVVSVTLPANEVTPESVKAAMIRKRAEFLPK